MRRLLVLLYFFPVLLVSSLFAQQSENYGTQRGEFSTWSSFHVGGNGHVFGFARDRSLTLAGIRYGWRIAEWKRWSGMTLRYTPEIIPIAYLRDRVIPGTNTPTLLPQFVPGAPTDQKYVYGAGANPVGLQLNFRRGKRFQPLWDVQGGFLYFSRRVLAAQGSQFQFTIASGPGAQFFLTPRSSLTVGYRYHHLSNANISNRNPGTDTNQLYFSFSLFR
jgi:hypothetical protein